ncbi:MAG: NAD(P)H steroid dehydrogenase-like protein in alkane synthesis cluster [Candidatus Ozemobacter sibiricus]|jgi:nucleoside-diphosphate-sugar epimerase|uniref:NAD(P)H steroid dehydrogenase-like protein in alkane synthesis cluster n=1 Tax=Candidatus Ozemobacter sibiricus TaxID=2268124 RepID=A0A367ZMQ4_9BACT|nr:MAG: NAD(P)H steroid dehydrogenase-like protein in alkane synthesis cluster [Candidatus Ozemobacter sibiricus]
MSNASSPAPGLPAGTQVLVTGGGGFLGKAIATMLAQRGVKVRSFSRGAYPELEHLGIETVRGDLTDRAAITNACRGCEVVFHVAAKAGMWGPYEEYYQANVIGTENVLAACRELKIKRLVYTSSPSVVFGGKDMENADESVPYSEHYETHYPRTKAMAEKLVLAANGPDLATVALRPHLIWGPGDNHLAPRMIAAARAGRLRIVGNNTNLVDTIYIDNAAEAHLLAAERLAPGAPCAGKAYFISNGEPRPLFDMVNLILVAAGEPPVTKTIPAGVAWCIGWAMEWIWTIFRLSGEPRMTRWLASEMSTAHWFNIAAARRDLGYEPRVSIDEGARRLAAWFKEHPPQPPHA